MPEHHRYVFLVDTSGSMRGVGGTPNIFGRVKSELKRFLASAPDGSTVQFNTFDARLNSGPTFDLPDERQAFQAYVDRLQANGQSTHVYRALDETLTALPEAQQSATMLYLLTDGKDNDQASATRLQSFLQRYQVQRGPHDWLYYITLGLQTPADVQQALKNVPRTQTLSAAPGQLPRLSVITIQPGQLNLGNLRLTPVAQRDLNVITQGTSVNLQAQVVSPDLERHGAYLTARLNAARSSGLSSVRFSLKNTETLPPGTYRARLCLSGPDGAAVQPGALELKLAYHPAAHYQLEAQKAAGTLELKRGEEQSVTYTLTGNPWATGPVAVEAQAPEGLGVTLNGQPQTQLRPGDRLQVILRNQALPSDRAQQVQLRLRAPDGETGPLAPLTVIQPKTFLERFWPLLMLAALLGAAALLWWWTSRRPWALAQIDGQTFKLRSEIVHLEQLTGSPDLRHLSLRRRNTQGRLHKIPEGVEVRAGRDLLETNDVLERNEEHTILRDGQLVARITLKQAR
ncbi:hypothetical protein GCM10010841_26210 [Deinococcus aerophilus]|uniref:VWFA domain-containing protein n=1 Tax=Deinococcus aerophilus TaxID=522488 RepID=A0ABQ2GXI0_9DEIO|nr:hypothetical protein GCM10010841_26210 [Deinococcus aerophilus]